MKHAYLILAHNEFDVLRKLVHALDDVRNDIYIHFDAKVKVRPRLTTLYSKVILTPVRLDVRWGDVSVVLAELELLKTAVDHGEYDYLHILSGVDMPLKSQDYIHLFFEKHKGKEFIGFYQKNNEKEIDLKVRRWHLFPTRFRDSSLSVRFLRALFLRLQILFHIQRNKKIPFKKGTQWVSITQSFAEFVLMNQAYIKKIYAHTFCPDEIVLQTICANSDFKNHIYDQYSESNGCLRAIKWEKNQIVAWTMNEMDQLLQSPMLFARKFSFSDMKLVDYLLSQITTHN